MNKLLLAAVALTASVGGSAMAADIPVKAPIYKAPIVVVYNWTGCFIGGNVGGLWLRKEYTVEAPSGATFGTIGQTSGRHDANSFIGGGQVGCDYQFGSLVIGIQGDRDAVNARGSHTDLFRTTLTDQSTTRSLASVTGRVGIAWDRFLGYVRGGPAWERDRYLRYVTLTSLPFSTAAESRKGWVLGLGGEYAFLPNLSAFIEYDHYDFGTRTITLQLVADGIDGYSGIRERKDVFKAGFNFRFGGPVAVRAAY